MSTPTRWFRRSTIMLAVALATYWPTIAAAAAPTAPVLRKGTPVWIGYATMFLLTMAVLVLSLMPSKRSHQD